MTSTLTALAAAARPELYGYLCKQCGRLLVLPPMDDNCRRRLPVGVCHGLEDAALFPVLHE
eukprot:9301969-Prorocentrum_lima.AAC.1